MVAGTMLRKGPGSLPPPALKLRPLFPTLEWYSPPPKPFPSSSVFWFCLVMANREARLQQQVFGLNPFPKCSTESRTLLWLCPSCSGLESGLRGGWESWPFPPPFTPCYSTSLSGQARWPHNELHQAINGWSEIKDGKEWQLRFELFSLLFSFKPIMGLCNRSR